MASYITLNDGSKWFIYKERNQNRVRPIHSQALMNICKYGGHVTSYPFHSDFGKLKKTANGKLELEFPPDLEPYFLGEHSLRLLQMARFQNLNEDYQFEALMFNSHKVYPPGDKYTPELNDKNQNRFDQLHIKKNRALIKMNMIVTRRTYGLSKDPTPRMVDINRQLLSNELWCLQDKSDDELEKMKIPKSSTIYDLKTGKKVDRIYPLGTTELTKMWWKEFNLLEGWDRYEEFRKNDLDEEWEDESDENGDFQE